MQVFQNIDMQPLNTFGIAAKAATFITLEKPQDIEVALQKFGPPAHILWGGSNILITKNIEGTIWHPAFRGIQQTEKDDAIELTIGAWEMMDSVVQYATQRSLWGIENLVAIPGCVGAAPVQNIGAYGVELKDVFVSCKTYDLQTKTIVHFSKDECGFAYRDSIFKQNPGRYIIIEVSILLSKIPNPIINYGDIQLALERNWYTKNKSITLTPAQIAETIEKIRRSKLPKPTDIGNIGSFFKNPFVEKAIVEKLLKDYPTIPNFIDKISTLYKIPAARLIEQSGLKWYRELNVWTYQNQPLVIVQYGWATGQEIYNFSEKIISKVFEKFSIGLEREANVW